MTDHARNVVLSCLAEYIRIIPDDDELLLQSHLFDSMGFVVFISHLEQKFEFQIPEGDLSEENFSSLGRIITYFSTVSDGKPDDSAPQRVT